MKRVWQSLRRRVQRNRVRAVARRRRKLLAESLEDRRLLAIGADWAGLGAADLLADPTPGGAALVGQDGPAEGEGEVLLRFRLEATDPSGNPIAAVQQGEGFQLRVYTQDIRASGAQGVFAAFMDVTYDSALATVSGPITAGPAYPGVTDLQFPHGNTTVPGLIDEAGGWSNSLTPLGSAEFLVVVIPFTAVDLGAVTFFSDPADVSPANDVLLYGGINGQIAPVPDAQIDYGTTTLTITPPLTEWVIDDGEAGYQEVGPGWFTGGLTAGNQNDYRFHSPGTGTNTASWTFTNLPSGAYDVYATWVAHENRPSNAPYQVFDGSTSLGTVAMNQRLAPNDVFAGGQSWELLGTFSAASGTLAVQVSDAGDGYVIADAIRVVAAGPMLFPPSIASLSANPNPVTLGDPLLLTAGGVTDTDGTVVQVDFYFDFNANQIWDEAQDVLLGTDTNGGDGWSLTVDTSTLPPGTRHFFARAQDNDSQFSNVAEAAVTITDPSAPTVVIIDDGDPGYSELGGEWFDSGVQPTYQGDSRFHSPGTGSASARWSFTGLTAGSYEVLASWGAHPNRASDAPFTIEAEGAATTVRVNQELIPDDVQIQGAAWERLGTATVGANGQLTVTLTDAANQYVSADAVLVRTVQPATLVGLSILGPSQVPESSVVSFTAMAQFDDGSTQDVTGLATWSEDCSAATIGSDGVLTTTSVTADQPCQVTAVYSGFTANKSITITDQPPVTDQIIDNGDAGYVEFGGEWFDSGVGGTYLGDSRFHGPGTGAATARWTFQGLAIGSYDVYASWGAHPNRASDAPFTISAGGAAATVRMNQELAPNDIQAQGVSWERLGTANVGADGQLVVTLSDAANEYVSSDAILVRPGSPAVVTDVTVSGPTDVSENSSASFQAIASFDNGSQQDVTSLAVWTENCTAATISSGGVLTTSEVSADEFCQVTATYSGVSGNHTVTIRDQAATPDRIIDDGDIGYVEMGGEWFDSGVTGTFNGDSRFHAPGTGSASAIWTFSGLNPAAYEVFASWGAHPNRASNARFNVSGGAQSINVVVNQELVPNDIQAQGTSWERLTTINVDSGGRLVVTLTDLANEYISADAILVRPGTPLVAAELGSFGGSSGSLTLDQLSPVVETAIEQWRAAGLSPDMVDRLENVEFVISDLPGTTLGLAFSSTVIVDHDGAGHGWILDGVSAGSAGTLSSDDGMDLLSVVAHELGHIAGLEDEARTGGLMDGVLASGMRRSVADTDVDAVFEAVDSWRWAD